MNLQQAIKRYPRIACALLSVADDTDVLWAAGVITAAKNTRTEMSVGLVREAWNKRHAPRSKAASRVVEMYVDDVSDVPNKKSQSLPKTG